jgi:hypothetical protein
MSLLQKKYRNILKNKGLRSLYKNEANLEIVLYYFKNYDSHKCR